MDTFSVPVAYMLKFLEWFDKMGINEEISSVGLGCFPRVTQLVNGRERIQTQGHLPTGLAVIFIPFYIECSLMYLY